jgi:hypothetical protein
MNVRDLSKETRHLVVIFLLVLFFDVAVEDVFHFVHVVIFLEIFHAYLRH